jgi:AsmA protein
MKTLLRWCGIAAAVLLLLAAGVFFLVDANRFRPLLESELTRALGREVKVGNLRVSLLSGGVTADDLSIADDAAFSRTPFVQAKSLKLGVEMWPLLVSRQLHVTRVTVEHPEIVLLQSASGDWNYASLGSRSAPPKPADAAPSGNLDLSVKLVRISDGRFSLGHIGARSKPLVLESVNLELRDFSASTVFPFSFTAKVAGGGEIKLDGKAGPLNQADLVSTPGSASLAIAKLDLAASGVVASAPWVAALASFDGSAESNGRTVKFKGKLKADHLKLARNGTPARRTVEFEFAAEHDLKRHAGRLSHGDIRIGRAPASLTGVYEERGESTHLNLNLAGPDMPVPELAEMLPALGIVLPAGAVLEGGTAGAKLAVAGPLDRLVTTGSVGLSHTRLTGFDLGKKMSVIERLAGIKSSPQTEIETFNASLRMSPEGMTAEGIQLVVPAIGQLSGNGTVSPANELAFKMSASVRAAMLGNSAIPFIVAGTASNPVIRPDVKGIVAGEAKSVAGSLLKGLLGGKKQ